MKKYLLSALFLFIFIQAKAQKYRFETSAVSISILDEKNKWSEFTKFKDAKLVVTLDTEKDRITVFSEIVQFFKIINYKEVVVKNNDEIASFECTNQDGEKCLISVYTYKNQAIKNRLYINYRDRIFAYNMKYSVK